MWNLFRKTPGALPQASWDFRAEPFRASAGNNPDLWAWLYPAQTNQYATYLNSWTGNQMPSFLSYVPVVATQNQVNRPWFTSTNKQQQNALQTAGSATPQLQFGQQETADYISGLGQTWMQNRGGGPSTKRKQAWPWLAGR